MKQNIFKIVIVVTGSVMMLLSCTKDFDTINTNPNTTPNALPQQLLAPALVNTMNYNMQRNRNFNNELMQVSVDISDAEGKVFRYDYRNNWSDYLYNGWYTQLTNFKDLYLIAKGEVNYNKSYMGISLICQAWIYSMLTDTYGDIPYFQSNLARESKIYEPAFDSQKDIYLDLFDRLEEADSLLTAGTAILAAADPVFNGTVANWRRFGNSLYLRLLLRVSAKEELSAFAIAKIKEIVDLNAAKYPIITSNAQTAVLKWTGIAPYSSPLNTIREQDFRAPGLGAFFIDHLRDWLHPCINIGTWGTNGFNRWGIAQGTNGFAGIPSGYAPGASIIKQSYFYSNTSAVSLQSDLNTGILMNYAEVQFILAEAAAKGWINGNAQTFYNNGVKATINYWLPLWNDDVQTYLSNADMQWFESDPLDTKMEKIHLQKYYALFLVDMQQWFEYRRTGHPVLPKGEGLRNNGIMPARMTYPVYVQSTNPTNYKLAVEAQGPDAISTEVWWQKR